MYLVRFFKLSKQDRTMLWRLSIYSLWAYFIISFIPFKKYVKYLGNCSDSQEIPLESALFRDKVEPLKRNIKRLERKAFWKTTCFSLAIAARLMLNKYKIKNHIFMGLTKDDTQKMSAHAWTKVSGQCISGCRNLEQYTVIHIF